MVISCYFQQYFGNLVTWYMNLNCHKKNIAGNNFRMEISISVHCDWWVFGLSRFCCYVLIKIQCAFSNWVFNILCIYYHLLMLLSLFWNILKVKSGLEDFTHKLKFSQKCYCKKYFHLDIRWNDQNWFLMPYTGNYQLMF